KMNVYHLDAWCSTYLPLKILPQNIRSLRTDCFEKGIMHWLIDTNLEHLHLYVSSTNLIPKKFLQHVLKFEKLKCLHLCMSYSNFSFPEIDVQFPFPVIREHFTFNALFPCEHERSKKN